MGKGIATHIGFDIYAHHMAHIGHKILGCSIDEPQEQIQEGQLADKTCR